MSISLITMSYGWVLKVLEKAERCVLLCEKIYEQRRGYVFKDLCDQK